MNKQVTISVELPFYSDKTFVPQLRDVDVSITTTESVAEIDLGNGVKYTGKDLVKETVETFPYKQMLDELESLESQKVTFLKNLEEIQARIDDIKGQQPEIEAKATVVLGAKLVESNPVEDVIPE